MYACTKKYKKNKSYSTKEKQMLWNMNITCFYGTDNVGVCEPTERLA